MGKSIRSKIKKRLRTAKRQRIDAMVILPREQEKHDRLVRTSQGRSVTLLKPKNGFKYPNADDAAFPQHEVLRPVDFRAQNLPMAGLVFRGNRRKYSPEDAEMLKNIAKTQHPKVEIMAGGGAFMAKTGKKVTMAEAELLATRVRRPEMAALHESEAPKDGSAPAASSTAPAAADDESDDDMEDEEEDGPEPEGSADTSRRPVLKDARRAKRTAEGRTRPKTVQKGGAGKLKAKEAQMANDAKVAAAQAAREAKK
mmetsp:Transcript_25202/g.40343  ORF Transcript_25202/g.40343 Transcript_25202/m.40343 type:complete len:255 (+) Transcript_25202:115-879(+)